VPKDPQEPHEGDHYEADEEKRLAVLRRLGILDTPSETVFDWVVKMATEVLEAPIGLVTFVGKDRQWHKATVGLQVREIAREYSFCTYAIKEPGPTIVEDLARDDRFAENPYVGSLKSEGSPGPEGSPESEGSLESEGAPLTGGGEDASVGGKGLRFYAGVPFSVEGQRLGTVCVLDRRPQSPPRKAVRQLRYLAGLVEEELRASLPDSSPDPLPASLPTSLPEGESEKALAEQEGRPLRKKEAAAQRKLEQTRKWLESCAEAAGAALFVAAPDYSATHYVNEAAEALYGVSREALRADPTAWMRHVHPDDRPVLEQSIEQQKQGNVQWPAHQRFRIQHPTKGLRWLQVSVRRVSTRPIGTEGRAGRGRAGRGGASPDGSGSDRAGSGEVGSGEVGSGEVGSGGAGPDRKDQGGIEQLAGIAMDVTKKKRRTEKLGRQNDLFRRAQQIANVGAWEFQVEAGSSELGPSESGSSESGWGMVTEQTLAIHGLPPEAELSPEKSLSFYHSEDQPKIREALRRAVEEQKPYDLELRLEDANGTMRWVRTRGEPQTEDGDVVRVRGTIQDITDRKQRERRIQQARQEAEEAARIKTALLSNMNHELRTPLTSILTFAKLIDQNPGAADQFAGRVLGGARRLLYTLNTVMEFAELEGEVHTDQRSGTEQRCQLDGTVRSVVADYRTQAQQKGIDVEVEVSKEGPVRLDSHLVERVLTHLVDNSVKFTEDGQITVRATVSEEELELQVHDTGVGIDSDFLPRAFDEFAQASTGLSRKYEGNGLGLTVAKRLVDRAGGDIEIESEAGKGTGVTACLPTGG
jgi:PAS domain S-box-containing protein